MPITMMSINLAREKKNALIKKSSTIRTDY